MLNPCSVKFHFTPFIVWLSIFITLFPLRERALSLYIHCSWWRISRLSYPVSLWCTVTSAGFDQPPSGDKLVWIIETIWIWINNHKKLRLEYKCWCGQYHQGVSWSPSNHVWRHILFHCQLMLLTDSSNGIGRGSETDNHPWPLALCEIIRPKTGIFSGFIDSVFTPPIKIVSNYYKMV